MGYNAKAAAIGFSVTMGALLLFLMMSMHTP
jgi:hypothetical protein